MFIKTTYESQSSLKSARACWYRSCIWCDLDALAASTLFSARWSTLTDFSLLYCSEPYHLTTNVSPVVLNKVFWRLRGTSALETTLAGYHVLPCFPHTTSPLTKSSSDCSSESEDKSEEPSSSENSISGSGFWKICYCWYLNRSLN